MVPMAHDLPESPGPEMDQLTAGLVVVGSPRVEVVPEREHGEAWTAGRVPIARGWSRQVDYQQN